MQFVPMWPNHGATFVIFQSAVGWLSGFQSADSDPSLPSLVSDLTMSSSIRIDCSFLVVAGARCIVGIRVCDDDDGRIGSVLMVAHRDSPSVSSTIHRSGHCAARQARQTESIADGG